MKYIVVGLILDLILGDPYSFPHPVKLMGRLIEGEEKFIRRLDLGPGKMRLAGLVLALVNIGLGYIPLYLVLNYLGKESLAYAILSSYTIYACLAARSLSYEAKKVGAALDQGLPQARHQLSFIVGRETENLSEEEVIRASIETVAENTSDGVIAPLFYIFLLGPAGGLMYKFVNTMDSMLGYKNPSYIDLGRYPALIDDLFNYIPARLTALIMGLIGLLVNRSSRAFRTIARDSRKHLSPNAGYPEAAVAGILGLALGGASYYNSKLVEKPLLGENINKIRRTNIEDSIRIMYGTELIFFLAGYYISLKI